MGLNEGQGSTPPGAESEEQAARWVRGMFSHVAGRYDLLNHLLSFQVDRYWRWRTVRRLRYILTRPDARVMDMCCGTGDLLLAIQAAHPGVALGSDFCHPMLTAAAAKIAKKSFPSVLFEADALSLPLADNSLDLITAAFGFRNLANYERGLQELGRVLRPGGVAAILEFSQPTNPAFAAFYSFYSRKILPLIGGTISGARDAYQYLPESVRKFPDAEGLAQKMSEAGFTQVEFERMTGGIVALHLGTK
jgi:demethylmenaquinone methyltransferase/2-methoxy-6-polyprenyl-1,4-benzoquinol methylase